MDQNDSNHTLLLLLGEVRGDIKALLRASERSDKQIADLEVKVDAIESQFHQRIGDLEARSHRTAGVAAVLAAIATALVSFGDTIIGMILK